MSETVSFKASKANPTTGETEVRRFTIDKDVSSSYAYLQQKLASVFPDISRKVFGVCWMDNDNDMVTIATDEDLIIALTEMEGPLYKINIIVKSGIEITHEEPAKGEVHPGVTCDGCQGAVHGYRYKCMSCPDFDLCSGCEAKGVHGEHNMIRMVKPLPTVWPHHFFKKFQRMQERAGAQQKAKENNSEDYNEGVHPPHPEGEHPHPPPPPHCGPPPHHGPQRGGPPHRRPMGRYGCMRGRGGGPMRGGFGPFFGGPNPFERMMGGWGRGWSMNCEDPRFDSNDPRFQYHDAPANDITEESAKQRQEDEEMMKQQTADVLNNLGQFVAAALDPFGIDVGVSVTTKDKPNENAEKSPETAKDATNIEKEKPMETEESTDDSEWTVIKDQAAKKAEEKNSEPTPGPSKAPETPGAAASPQPPSAPQDQEMMDPKIQVALEAMLNMGFTNDGGWLTTLLEAKQGDISKVLDMLQPVRK